MPRLRMQAARLVFNKGWSTRQAAKYTGFNQSSIVRWTNILKKHNFWSMIPTNSSRPHSHPKTLSQDIVDTIISYRQKYRRCAEVIHFMLVRDGYIVSLSSVKRTLKRAGLTKYNKLKKWHTYPPRPIPEKPGILVQVDTIVDGPPEARLYIYTMLDVCTRWSFALPVLKINTYASWNFITKAKNIVPFNLDMIQSDHGSEFSKWFTEKLNTYDIKHRHSRVRTPTDNGHLERFNRTIQEECLLRIPKTFAAYKKAIPEYIHYYNTQRPHMSLNMKTPLEVMQSY